MAAGDGAYSCGIIEAHVRPTHRSRRVANSRSDGQGPTRIGQAEDEARVPGGLFGRGINPFLMDQFEFQREPVARGTVCRSTSLSGARAGAGGATRYEVPGTQQGTGTAPTCPVASPPVEYSKRLKGRAPRERTRGDSTGQQHGLEHDGGNAFEFPRSSEARRPGCDAIDVDDAALSVPSPEESVGGTCGPASAISTTSPDRAMLPGKRLRYSTIPPCGREAPARRGERGRRRTCGLKVCGSNLQYRRGPGGTCEDCPDGPTHDDGDLLCAACHRPLGVTSKHLGENLRPLATAWVAESRETGAGLPAPVLASFEPSESCLCSRIDCFYAGLSRHKRQITERRCTPCGTKSASKFRMAGSKHRLYQLFFSEGNGAKRKAHKRTKTGMGVTEEAITADSWICCACLTAFTSSVARGWRPTLEVAMATPMAMSSPEPCPSQAVAIIMRNAKESLARGELVCSEDMEQYLRGVREENGLAATSVYQNRTAVRQALRNINDECSDVFLQEFPGSAFGDDGRTRYGYLAVVPVRIEKAIACHHEVRRKNQEIGDLRRQLQEARVETSSDASRRR